MDQIQSCTSAVTQLKKIIMLLFISALPDYTTSNVADIALPNNERAHPILLFKINKRSE